MANTCPTGYQWYVCSSIGYTGCCSVDACAAPGCPPGSTAPPITPPGATPQPTQTAQSSSSRGTTLLTSKITLTQPGTTQTSITVVPYTPGPPDSPTQSSATASSAQQSRTASSTQIGSKSPSHSSRPLLSIIAISIGGALGILIIALIIFLYRRRRRRRKTENSGGGLPTHSGVPEPTLDDGLVTGISNSTQNPVSTPPLTKSRHRRAWRLLRPLQTPPPNFHRQNYN